MKFVKLPVPKTLPGKRWSRLPLLLPLLLLFSHPAWAYPIPDTGQTESYTTTFGEDSDYLINPPSYTKLGASGNDLPDSAAEWFMVRDNVTGLIWEVKRNKDGVPNYGDHHDADNTYTWYDGNPDTNGGDAGTPGDGTDTEDFINALNAQWFGGHNDWRLPTVKELASIVNLGTYDPAIDTAYFSHTVSSSYWSSTATKIKVITFLDAVCEIDFGNGGHSSSLNLKSDTYYVRAVRGGQTGSLGHLVINGDGTVTDASSGLMWQQVMAATDMIWESAVSYCEGLSLSGYADWRLPSRKELRTIVDYSVYNPAIYTTYFPHTVSHSYASWSSTIDANNTVYAWYIYFLYGFDGSENFGSKSSDNFVRAVRGGQAQLFGHLLISSPAQASTWNVGSTMPIRWDTAGISGNVKISISPQGGKTGTFETIVESTPNNGSYDWIVDGGTSVNYALRVEPLNDTSKGTTQSLFTINNFSRKAIIVAGGGDYEGNTLWDATRKCANYAYVALNFQGYGKDNIFYLSSETDLDLDNDGVVDVKGDATNALLENAVKTWAAEGDNLFIYLVGHGGDGTFRMGPLENLYASDLDRWLDDLQKTLPGFAIVLYDACSSGSFLPALSQDAGKERIVVASAAADEVAVFQVDGGLSFGYQFFSHLFGGATFYESFVHGKKSIEGTLAGSQSPQMEGNGNGIGNQKDDLSIARGIRVGDENKTANDLPMIGSVSPAQSLSDGETRAVIHATEVVDADGIQEVFAVIKPPDYTGGTGDNPVTDLPTVTLTSVGSGRYEGNYGGFTVPGTYHMAVFARDGKGTLSLPGRTTVIKSGGCLNVNNDLSIRLPCVRHGDEKYAFTFEYYGNPGGSGYCWWLNKTTLGGGDDTGGCLFTDASLAIDIPCATYNGAKYGFTLRFRDDPNGGNELTWQMDMTTLKVN